MFHQLQYRLPSVLGCVMLLISGLSNISNEVKYSYINVEL